MRDQKANILKIAEIDDVGIALSALEIGDQLTDDNSLSCNERVMRGHKVALRDIAEGELVRKYGQAIGVASEKISAGSHVHSHNLSGDLLDRRADTNDVTSSSVKLDGLPDTFMGYRRSDGSVGTRNYIALLSTVNCSATVCRTVADHFNNSGILDGYPNIDGVVALSHGLGCAIDPKGYGIDILQRTLVGAALNPNVGATVIVGLGCETNQAHFMLKRHGVDETTRLKSFSIQEAGGTRKSIDRAISWIGNMLDEVNEQARTEEPVSELRLALQCGGSDSYSGITANPALGVAADILVAKGGTAILSETPEIYGAEHLLAVRSQSAAVADRLMSLIDWWRDYTKKSGASIENNPSYGNKMGGLTTIAEKSLGAIAKSGTSPLRAVYGYGEKVTEHGLVFVDTPGYDPICSTGQIASGATIMCFTTGRGSVSGFKPVPTLKLSTNSQLYDHMSDDMDFDCGTIINGELLEDVGRRIFSQIVETASGKQTRSEIYGFGDNEFVPWQLGAIL